MQSISVFLDITRVSNFRRRNVDVSSTQGVCRVIHIFFGSSFDKAQPCQVSSYRIYLADFREKDLFAPVNPRAARNVKSKLQ